MIEFKRIDHIAMAVADTEMQTALFEGLFGFRRTAAWEDGVEGTRGITLAIPGDGSVTWEVISPASESSPLQAFLDSPRGPGLHHVGVEVEDLATTRSAITAIGARASTASTDTKVVVSAEGAGEGIQFQFFTGAAHSGVRGLDRPASAEPSLGITGLDHVCTAFPDRDELSNHYARMLGMKQIWRTPDGAWPDFGDCVLEIPGKQLHWEIIQPVGDESFIRRFIDARGPAVHHVAFEVADFDAALAACEHYGVPTFDEHDDETEGIRWRDAFIHPKHTGGLLAQIYWEAEPNTWIRSDKVRPDGYTP
jgi:4-hydroxyphenylpyruvate dioxygenase-like putative hemolysin